MKTRLLIVCLALTLPFGLLADDVLRLRNGLSKSGRIVEQTDNYVVLEKPGTGTLEIISVADIAGMEHGDGRLARPAGDDGPDLLQSPEDGQENIYNKKNIIGLNYLEFGILLNAHLSYERILSQGYLGLALSYAMSLEPIRNKETDISNLNYYYKNRYSFDINIYPLGQHRVSYYIGPSLIYGTFEYDDDDVTTPTEERSYSSFLINNGVVFQIVPNFSMGIRAGIGIIRELDGTEYRGINASVPLIGFNVALRL